MEHQGLNDPLLYSTTLRGNAAGGPAADKDGYHPNMAAALKASAEYLSTSDRKPLPFGPFASIADMELFLKSYYDRVAFGGALSGQPIAPDVASRPSAGVKGGSLGKSVHSAAILGAQGQAKPNAPGTTANPATSQPIVDRREALDNLKAHADSIAAAGSWGSQLERRIDIAISRLGHHVVFLRANLDRLAAANTRLSGAVPCGLQQDDQMAVPGPGDSSMARLGHWLSEALQLAELIEGEIARLEATI